MHEYVWVLLCVARGCDIAQDDLPFPAPTYSKESVAELIEAAGPATIERGRRVREPVSGALPSDRGADGAKGRVASALRLCCEATLLLPLDEGRPSESTGAARREPRRSIYQLPPRSTLFTKKHRLLRSTAY